MALLHADNLSKSFGSVIAADRIEVSIEEHEVIGVIGAMIGGFVATYLGFGGISGFDIRSLVIATLGAIILLIVLRLFKGGKRER